MIALNEVVSNKDVFETKYKLMGKKFNLDKICELEKIFSSLNQETNSMRSNCNKLCENIANLINEQKDTCAAMNQIENLNKQIKINQNKANKLYKAINKSLKKLPNLPLNDNILNIEHKTMFNDSFDENNLKTEIEKLVKTFKPCDKNFTTKLKDNVIDTNLLPFAVNNKNEIIVFCTNSNNLFEKLKQILINNSKMLFEKSIKTLKKESSTELIATLKNNLEIFASNSGEFVSRDLNIKYKDNSSEMTKFIQTISIKFSK